MQLREIRIHGFGAFSNAVVSGLAPGINVLHGPNEYGKTTLLEFVRRILFGFPPKTTKANQYPALNSDRYGGELVCLLRDGRTVAIGRTAGKSAAGTVTVSTLEGQPLAEPGLSVIGNLSADLYHKVYSIGLDELYQIDVLDLDEVKDYVYGAGLGGVRLSVLRERFEKRAGELYTKGGHKQRMKELATDIARLNSSIRDERDRLSQYDRKKEQREQLQQTADALASRLPALQAESALTQSRERLYPSFSRMRQAERDLAEMGRVQHVPDDAVVQLKERLAEVERLSTELEEQRSELQLRQAACDRIGYDASIISMADEVRALSHSVAAYRAALEDLPATERELTEARSQLQRELATLGGEWTAEKARTFTLTTGQDDALRQTAARHDGCRAALNNARTKLELHRDHVRATQSRRGFSGNVRLGGIGLAALAGAGCVLAALNGDVPVAVITGVTGLLILIAAVRLSASAAAMRDPAAEELEAEIRSREAELQSVASEWDALLQSVGLPSGLSAAAKDESLRRIAEVAEDLQRVDGLATRVDKMRQTLASVGERYSRVAAALNEPPAATDTAARIEAYAGRLSRASEEKVRKEMLQQEISQRTDAVSSLETRRHDALQRLSGLLADYSAASPEELRAKHARSAKALELVKTRADSLRIIEIERGAGEACEGFIKSLEATTLDDIRLAGAELKQQVQEAQRQLTEVTRQLGEMDSELKALESAADLIRHEAEYERLKQQLQDAYREWLTARIALHGIDAAVSRYEEERQPDVIRFAETSFIGMTNGRYERLLKSVESGELHIREANGRTKTVEQLSRGTREQLYLAMRLGLIEQHELNAEPLPVIMDDILVNFDDERGPLAVQSLADFARKRQVIVMTCHESTRELYRRVGATEVAIRPGNLL